MAVMIKFQNPDIFMVSKFDEIQEITQKNYNV